LSRSIRTRIRFWGILLATVPVLALGLFTGAISFHQQYRQTLADQARSAALLISQIESRLLQAEQTLLTALDAAEFHSASHNERFAVLNALAERLPNIEQLGFLDPDGHEQIRVSHLHPWPEESLRDRSEDSIFAVPRKERLPYYTDLDFSLLTGEPHIEIGLPLLDEHSGTLVGVLTAEVRVRMIWELLEAFYQHPGSEGENAYILDASGRVFAHRDPAVVITAQTVDLPVHRGSGRTLEGRRALRSARTFAVRNLPFHLVVERRLANAFDLSFTMVAAVLAFAVLASLTALTVTLRSSRSLLNPLMRLTAISEKIRDQDRYDFSSLRAVKTSNWTEISVLADAISSMVEQLQEKIAQVGSSLNEREVLLRELHHRVKNNLQIIISLTNLQTDALVNPHDAEVFRSLQHRIYSLALVHEQLYQSVSLSRIEIGRYLHAMLSYLNNNYHKPGREIEIRTEIDTVDAAIEPAVAFGMLISEVVSNSLKHGFADRTSGTLTVHLSHQSPAVVLSVCDDGVGLPNKHAVEIGSWCGADHANSTAAPDSPTGTQFGMLLIAELVQRLNGEVCYKAAPDGGTRFELRVDRSQL